MESDDRLTMKSKLIYSSLSLLLLIILLEIWQLAASSPRIQFLFSSPLDVVGSLIANTINGILPFQMLITGTESLLGFILGVSLGTLIGFLLWYSPLVSHITKPYLVIIGAIPVFAFAPLIILWFGIGMEMKIAMAAFATFLISLTQAHEGSKNVDLDEFRLLNIYGASRYQLLCKIVLPSSISWVLSSMKLSVGLALLGAFIGEFISSNQGLGHFMLRAGSFYDISSVFAGGIYMIILSLLFGLAVSVVEKNKMKIVGALSVDKRLRKLLGDSSV